MNRAYPEGYDIFTVAVRFIANPRHSVHYEPDGDSSWIHQLEDDFSMIETSLLKATNSAIDTKWWSNTYSQIRRNKIILLPIPNGTRKLSHQIVERLNQVQHVVLMLLLGQV